ncbi:MAG: lytic murein transglycosylase [Sphingomonadaceae bacterium]
MRHLLLAVLLWAAPAAAGNADFAAWLERYKAAAAERGVRPEWLAQALVDLAPSERVVALDRNQPGDSGVRAVFSAYLARQLTVDRIAEGRRMKDRWATASARAEADHGVPREILLGIWGMETNYGRHTGNFDVLQALATLAWDGRREALFTRELDAAVQMLGEGRATRAQMRGSWAGAMGLPQFLPSSYLAHAVDGDGDGRADIWNSVPDTLASIGNYLKNNGWQAGLGWGFATRVPAGFDPASVALTEQPTSCIRPMQAHSRFLTASAWRAMGFQPLNAAWPADEVEMSFVQPDGPGTSAYLTTRNYRALMAYNCSNFYALSVALLADALR